MDSRRRRTIVGGAEGAPDHSRDKVPAPVNRRQSERRLGRRRAARRRDGRGQPRAARPRPRARRPARRTGRRGAHRRRRRPQSSPRRSSPAAPTRSTSSTTRDLGHYLAQPYAQVVTTLIREHRPQIVLYGATTLGPRPGAARGLRPCGPASPPTAPTCTSATTRSRREVQEPALPDPAGVRRQHHRHDHQLDSWPQMATVREGVMVMPEEDRRRDGRIIAVPVTRTPSRSRCAKAWRSATPTSRSS